MLPRVNINFVEVKIGNIYIKSFCNKCNKESWHRVFKRFGSGEKGKGKKGKKFLKRKVTYCLNCQKRVIENTRKARKRAIVMR